MDNYLGEIRVFGFNFPPRGWAVCNGQSLPISQNQALYSLLGTQYGGNGVTTFNLPNFQCNALLGAGSGNGLNVTVGQTGGSNTVTLTTDQLPAHTHLMQAVDAAGSAAIGNSNHYLSQLSIQTVTTPHTFYVANGYSTALGAPVALAPASVSSQGGNAAHENRMPFLAMYVCICTSGIYPTRN